jgi:hypothetical protein
MPALQGAKSIGAGYRREDPRRIAELQEEMQTQMMQPVAEGTDVSEIYSPPRVSKRADQWGLTGGWSLDLTTKDSD